jgi:CheY-like chemotaxis protein
VEEFEASAGLEPPATLRSAARLAAPVLRHLGDHADVRLTASEMARVAGASPQEGEQLTAWLLRAGLVQRALGAGDEPAYVLATGTRRATRGGLVLLVEDHTSVACRTEGLLASEGYTVVIARNPLEAHALLRALSFDLILTDSFGPTLELSVRVLAPLLRRAVCTPVVLFTAHHWEVARVQAEGFTDIIHQPLAVEPFLQRVERLLELRQTASLG